MIKMNDPALSSLLRELRLLPHETEWVEFKQDNANPEEIGEYISALSNSAAMNGKTTAFIIWGIDNRLQEIKGTTFRPSKKKIGKEELENWLLRLLSPKINFRFYEVDEDGKHIVILEINRAFRNPVQFKGNEYIRVGSYKRKLKDFPEKERELWRIFDSITFEEDIASQGHTADEVLSLIDYPSYFDLLSIPLPSGKSGILDSLCNERIIIKNNKGFWDITNFGAILFAKKLENFDSIKRKAVRVIVYNGSSRIETIREQKGLKGYASGFDGLIQFINTLLPMNEVIEKALRKNVTMYPEISVRELVVNAIIHQDFYITGGGPMIEIFDDRMEITNPGIPLVATDRFIDSPPRSRNEMLASFMRRIGVCEERGSGVDKVIFQTELYQLPAPVFETIGDNTRAILFSHKSFSEMDKEDRIRATYQHACLRYVSREYMMNASLRDRFGIEEQNSATASRIIKDAVKKGFIHLYDPEASNKYRKYVPYWA
jgi:predicted HTH transcriptional regulator